MGYYYSICFGCYLLAQYPLPPLSNRTPMLFRRQYDQLNYMLTRTLLQEGTVRWCSLTSKMSIKGFEKALFNDTGNTHFSFLLHLPPQNLAMRLEIKQSFEDLEVTMRMNALCEDWWCIKIKESWELTPWWKGCPNLDDHPRFPGGEVHPLWLWWGFYCTYLTEIPTGQLCAMSIKLNVFWTTQGF